MTASLRFALVGAAFMAAPSILRAQGVVRVAAVVSAPQTYEVRRDSVQARRIAPDVVRLAEGLSVRVQAGAGSVVRALPADTGRAVRIVVDYVGS